MAAGRRPRGALAAGPDAGRTGWPSAGREEMGDAAGPRQRVSGPRAAYLRCNHH